MKRSRLAFSLCALALGGCGTVEAPARASLEPPPPVVLPMYGRATSAAGVPSGDGTATSAADPGRDEAAAGARADVAALEAEARARIAPFAAQMLAAVQQAMAAGGPVAAIGACQVLAPAIAGEHSVAPWTVGRTSLRLRNPANAPDAWERAVLERFAASAAQGRPLAELRHGEVVAGEYRYMQAIATGEPCLACHGTAVAAPVRQALRDRYPQDAATGFVAGELRGAFTMRRRLD